ncbi:MAG: hypothetical protein P4L49_11425 [Desulfosporosinus sp.]|nr:hypothetical protein [Desulfosporosinus sp.]
MDKSSLFQEISHALVEFEVEQVATLAEETLRQNIPAYEKIQVVNNLG